MLRCQLCVVHAVLAPTLDWRAKAEWLAGRLRLQRRQPPVLAGQLPAASDMLAWLWSLGPPVGALAVAVALRKGDVTSLRWLLRAGVQLDEVANVGPLAGWMAELFEIQAVPESAAEPTWTVRKVGTVLALEAGNAAGLRCLLEAGVRMDEAAGPLAAGWGRLAALRALQEAGVRVDASSVTLSAAVSGHLHIVAWAVDALEGGQQALTARVLALAAESGNMELLAWVRGRGCPWDANAYSHAAKGGKVEVLEWLGEGGCPKGGADHSPYSWAATNGDPATLAALRAMPSPWRLAPEQLARALLGGCGVHVLRWLHGQPGCRGDWGPLAGLAAASPDDQVVLWVAQRRPEGGGAPEGWAARLAEAERRQGAWRAGAGCPLARMLDVLLSPDGVAGLWLYLTPAAAAAFVGALAARRSGLRPVQRRRNAHA